MSGAQTPRACAGRNTGAGPDVERSFDMIAMLFAYKIALGAISFDDVPRLLRDKVAAELIDTCGMPELVPAEYGGSPADE